jgi:Uma2 family endonuclease
VINDTGFVLARDPDTVRGPDVAFVCRARVERLAHPEQAFPGAPDLAIEILSPSNTPSNVHAKVADYLSAGSPLVWVLDPGHQRVRIYRTLLAPRTVDGDEELDGEDIVPGFRVMVSGILGG